MNDESETRYWLERHRKHTPNSVRVNVRGRFVCTEDWRYVLHVNSLRELVSREDLQIDQHWMVYI